MRFFNPSSLQSSILFVVSFALIILTPDLVSSSQNRVALVIGNGSYRNSPLRNPVHDARTMRDLLTRAGFQVTKLENANKRELVNSINDFGFFSLTFFFPSLNTISP